MCPVNRLPSQVEELAGEEVLEGGAAWPTRVGDGAGKDVWGQGIKRRPRRNFPAFRTSHEAIRGLPICNQRTGTGEDWKELAGGRPGSLAYQNQ